MGDGRVGWVRCERFMWRQRLHDAVCLRARLASRGAVLRAFIVLFCLRVKFPKNDIYTQTAILINNDGGNGGDE